jgi:hypothetical protein
VGSTKVLGSPSPAARNGVQCRRKPRPRKSQRPRFSFSSRRRPSIPRAPLRTLLELHLFLAGWLVPEALVWGTIKCPIKCLTPTPPVRCPKPPPIRSVLTSHLRAKAKYPRLAAYGGPIGWPLATPIRDALDWVAVVSAAYPSLVISSKMQLWTPLFTFLPCTVPPSSLITSLIQIPHLEVFHAARRARR